MRRSPGPFDRYSLRLPTVERIRFASADRHPYPRGPPHAAGPTSRVNPVTAPSSSMSKERVVGAVRRIAEARGAHAAGPRRATWATTEPARTRRPALFRLGITLPIARLTVMPFCRRRVGGRSAAALSEAVDPVPRWCSFQLSE